MIEWKSTIVRSKVDKPLLNEIIACILIEVFKRIYAFFKLDELCFEEASCAPTKSSVDQIVFIFMCLIFSYS